MRVPVALEPVVSVPIAMRPATVSIGIAPLSVDAGFQFSDDAQPGDALMALPAETKGFDQAVPSDHTFVTESHRRIFIAVPIQSPDLLFGVDAPIEGAIILGGGGIAIGGGGVVIKGD